MSTDQKYDGKESHANSPQSIEQTVNSDLQAATSADPVTNEPPFTLIDPLPDNSNGSPIKDDRPQVPLTYQLPFFFTWQVRNQEQVCKLLGAIDTIFYEFGRSRRAKETIDEDPDVNQVLAYRMLQISIEDIVHQAAAQRIENYKKPATKEYMFLELPELATGDPEPDTNPALALNPTDCTDIVKLQEWVSSLQQMCRLQQNMNDSLEQVNTAQGELTKEQSGAIENLKRQIEILEQINKNQEANRVRHELDRKVPDSQHYIDLTLYLTDGLESEVELVRQVIADASEAKLEEMLEMIVNNESDCAFFKYEEYKKLQGVLAKISNELTEVGYNSYLRAHYGNRPQDYVRSEEHDLKVFHKDKAKFIDKFCVFTIREEEPETSVNEQVKPLLDPEFYLDITETEKDVLNFLQAKGLSEDELEHWAVNFQNQSFGTFVKPLADADSTETENEG